MDKIDDRNSAASHQPFSNGYRRFARVEGNSHWKELSPPPCSSLRRGEVVGLLGPNGAGKTTSFYMITGLLPVDYGTIELDGHYITDFPMYRRARLGIGYLPQEASIFRGLTAEENIRAAAELVEPDEPGWFERFGCKSACCGALGQ